MLASPPITILPEFRDLIPPLGRSELEALESSILADGVRDALVVWAERGVLLDGHNRIAIAQRHNLPFKTVELSFADETDAKRWMVATQLGRRNLNPFQRVELVLRLEDTAPFRGRRLSAGKVVLVSGGADRELARLAGVGHDLVHKCRILVRQADAKTLERLRQGRTTVNAAYVELRRQERVAAIQAHAAADGCGRLRELQDGAGRYRCVYVDPPWTYRDRGCRGATGGHYPTLSLEQLAALPVGQLAHPEGSHFWL